MNRGLDRGGESGRFEQNEMVKYKHGGRKRDDANEQTLLGESYETQRDQRDQRWEYGSGELVKDQSEAGQM